MSRLGNPTSYSLLLARLDSVDWCRQSLTSFGRRTECVHSTGYRVSQVNIPTSYRRWSLVSIPTPVIPRLAVWVSTCANTLDRSHVDPAGTQSSACECDTNHVARVRSCAFPPSEIARPIDATHCETANAHRTTLGSIWCPSSPALAVQIAEPRWAAIGTHPCPDYRSCQSLSSTPIHVDRSPKVEMVSRCRVRGPTWNASVAGLQAGKPLQRAETRSWTIYYAALGKFIVRVAIALLSSTGNVQCSMLSCPPPPFLFWNSLFSWPILPHPCMFGPTYPHAWGNWLQ